MELIFIDLSDWRMKRVRGGCACTSRKGVSAVLVVSDFIGSCRNLSLCCLAVTEQGRVCIYIHTD